ncbi:MAG TPA: cyclic nucleotide-binding protein, partial [Pedobacter sp.]
MQTVTLSWLKTLDILKDVPDNQLQWFIDNSENHIVGDGEVLFKPGEPITGPHLIVNGGIQFYMMQNGSKREFTTFNR